MMMAAALPLERFIAKTSPSINEQFPPPPNMRRRDGSARFAYVTFLLANLSHNFVASALLLAYALRKQHTQADIVCIVNEGLPREALAALESVFDYVVQVPTVFFPHKRRHERPDRPFLFTRFHALRLGRDGDLGFDYEKLVILDADVLPLRHYDHLFTLDTPAGIINECKGHMMDYDAQGRYRIPASVEQDSTWKWHRIYGDICPHGQPIPREITDRVGEDVSNMGIIGALYVLRPCQREFESMLDEITHCPRIKRLVGDLFDWPDMQYLTLRWSGKWTNVDVRFCSLGGYPRLSALFGTHYAGLKPWAFNQPKALARYSRHEDFRLWYSLFVEMMTQSYPSLQRVPSLCRLLQKIRQTSVKLA
jgi:glycogenin glucosyltransferase